VIQQVDSLDAPQDSRQARRTGVLSAHDSRTKGLVDLTEPWGADAKEGGCQAVTRVSWYVASLADGDTYLADPSEDALVIARCDGRQFRPLVALTKSPLDQAQICPACRGVR